MWICLFVCWNFTGFSWTFFGNYFGFWSVFLGQKLALVVDMLKTLFEVSLDQPFGVLWGHQTGKWYGHGGGDDQTSMMSFVWEASTGQSMQYWTRDSDGSEGGRFLLEKLHLGAMCWVELGSCLAVMFNPVTVLRGHCIYHSCTNSYNCYILVTIIGKYTIHGASKLANISKKRRCINCLKKTFVWTWTLRWFSFFCFLAKDCPPKLLGKTSKRISILLWIGQNRLVPCPAPGQLTYPWLREQYAAGRLLRPLQWHQPWRIVMQLRCAGKFEKWRRESGR